jgi:methyltransferase (TIGR00027 family)
MAVALRAPLLRSYGRSATFAFLAARTRWFDEVVVHAVADGIDQVVVVGAGYDARPWRLRFEGMRWFEVDHPATQRVKRQRAPAGRPAPVFVGLDLRKEPVDERLRAAGLDPARPSAFILEGLTMYLTPEVCERLFAALGTVGAPGSVLAVQFSETGGGSTSPVSRAVADVIRAVWSWSGEATFHWADEDLTGAMLEGAGWYVEETARGDAMARRYLEDTDLRWEHVNRGVYCTRARRR